MSNYEVGVRLTADGRNLVSEASAAKDALGGLRGEQRQASSESANYTTQVERQNTALGSLKTGIIAAAGAYVSFNAAIAGGKAVVNAALAQERLNNSLRVGLGSQQAATKEIKFLREESDRLGLQFTSTAEQYAKLAAASKGTALEGQKTRDIFLSVAKASTVLGLSAADSGGVLTAFQQIISKGKVSTEELLQVAERVPGTFATVARAMDVTGEELSDMLRKGEIMADDLLPRLAAEYERTYGAEAQEAAKGLNSQINRLDNSFTDLKLAVGRTGIIDLFSDGIQIADQFIGKVADVVDIVGKIPGVKNATSAAFGGGVLGLIFGKDAKAAQTDIRETTAALAQAEEVINRIVRPGAKPEAPKEFIAAIKAEARERKKLADQVIRDAQNAAKAREREEKQAVDSARRIIDSLRRETDEIGKNAVQKRLMAAAAEAAQAPTRELAQEIMASAQAWAQATDAQNQALALQKDQEEAARKRAQAETEAARQVEQEWGRMWSTVENTARTSFVQFAAHGKNAMESIGRSIQNSIIDLLYQLTLRPFVINVGTRLFGGGSGAGGAGGASGALNAGLSAASFFNVGSGAFSGSGLLGSFGAGFSGGSSAAAFIGAESAVAGAGAAASLGASVAAIAAPAAALLAVDQIGKFLANGRTTGTFVDKIPVIGGLAGAIFGRKPFKFDREDLLGTITAEGFKGVFNDSRKAKGGLARGSRRDNIIVDTRSGELLNEFGRLSESGISSQLDRFIDPAIQRALELGSALDESVATTVKSLRSVADTLGISAASLDDFNFSVDLTTKKGEQLTDADIAEVIANATEQMATGLIPEIGDLANRGESALQTVVRLGSEFSALEGVLRLTGNTSSEAQALLQSYSLEQRSAAAELAGGVNALNGKTQLFFNNVLTDTQKFEAVSSDLRKELEKYGVTTIPTIEQLNNAVTSGKLNLEQFAAALDLTPMILQANQLRDSMVDAADATKEAENEERALANYRRSITAGRRESQQNVINLAEERKRRSVEADIRSADERAQRERDLLKLRFDNERRALEESKRRSQEITGFVSSLRRSAASVSPLGFAESGNIISTAIDRVANGEDFQNIITDRLQSAVSASGNINERLFSSFADFARARGAAASGINELAALGENQLTTEGQTLTELQQQTALMQKTFDVLNRRIDFGAEFDKSLAGQSVSGVFLTPGGTAKRAAVQDAQRQIYILENDLESDPRAMLQARLQLIRASATPETVYGGGKLTQDIQDMIKNLQKLTTEQFLTNQMLKRVSGEGDALRTRGVS